MQACSLERINSGNNTCWDQWDGEQFNKEGSRASHAGQAGHLPATHLHSKDGILDCIRKSIKSRWKAVILLFSTAETHLEWWVQVPVQRKHWPPSIWCFYSHWLYILLPFSAIWSQLLWFCTLLESPVHTVPNLPLFSHSVDYYLSQLLTAITAIGCH